MKLNEIAPKGQAKKRGANVLSSKDESHLEKISHRVRVPKAIPIDPATAQRLGLIFLITGDDPQEELIQIIQDWVVDQEAHHNIPAGRFN